MKNIGKNLEDKLVSDKPHTQKIHLLEMDELYTKKANQIRVWTAELTKTILKITFPKSTKLFERTTGYES
jgi:hypothetical protein